MLPSRRVLAYDTSYFALCQHLFSDFFRFFSAAIICGVLGQENTNCRGRSLIDPRRASGLAEAAAWGHAALQVRRKWRAARRSAPTGAVHRIKPPLGDQGEVAGHRPDGGDQNFRSPPAHNPSVSLRLTAPLHRGAFRRPYDAA